MPRNLPVAALSLSAIGTLRKCAYKYKLRYVDHLYEPSTAPQLLGKVFGAAEAQSDHEWIDSGAPLDVDQVLDAYSDEFEFAKGGDVDWKGEQPEQVKDSGVGVLRIYHATVAALSAPIEAERKFRLEIEDVPFVGYIDVEREDGAVEDRKLIKSPMSQDSADSDQQVSAYLAGRRAEGNPATGFVFDTAVKATKTLQPRAQRVETDRTDEQLDQFLLGVVKAADEIEWRMETDNWSFAPPGAWWCGPSCGYWDQCPAGGLLRKRAAAAVKMGALP